MSELQEYLINKGLIKSLKIEISKEKTRIIPESPMSATTLFGELLLVLIQQYLCNIEVYKDKDFNKYVIMVLKELIKEMEKNKDEK